MPQNAETERPSPTTNRCSEYWKYDTENVSNTWNQSAFRVATSALQITVKRPLLGRLTPRPFIGAHKLLSPDECAWVALQISTSGYDRYQPCPCYLTLQVGSSCMSILIGRWSRERNHPSSEDAIRYCFKSTHTHHSPLSLTALSPPLATPAVTRLAYSA